jgi:hypothetical protein
MYVIPTKVDSINSSDPLNGVFGITGFNQQPKLRIDDSCLTIVVRMCVDSRVEAQQRVDSSTVFTEQLSQQVNLIEVVDHNFTDTGIESHSKLVRRFVVPVEGNVLWWKPRLNGYVQFSTRHDIQSQPFLTNDVDQRGREPRLTCIYNTGTRVGVSKRLPIQPALLPDGAIVVHIERRAVSISQLRQHDTTDGQTSGVVTICRHRP